MALRIDRVDTEIEILRKETGDGSPAAGGSVGGEESLATVRGRAALREQLRPIVLEILEDELARLKRKVGAP